MKNAKEKKGRFAPVFVALIAACNRPALLAKRALPSLAAQTRKPDMVIVADDSNPPSRARNRQTAAAFGASFGIKTIFTPNCRGKGASGAWNSGALAAIAALKDHDAGNVYLAILDDDDEWMPNHLEDAERSLNQHGAADIAAAAFERREGRRRLPISPPQKLNGRDFLTGNPGVCGSSLIFRLRAFLRAGMFDEALPACTDIDLCFRLSLLPNIKYHRLPQTSVTHCADARRPRLSLGAVKHLGLARFVDKYRGWMSDKEYVAFCDRAKKLFGWKCKNPPTKKTAKPELKSPPPISAKNAEISLVVGVIFDPRSPPFALFADLLRLAKDRRLLATDVVLMTADDSCRRRFAAEAAKWRRAGLRLYCIDGRAVGAQLLDFLGIAPSTRPRSIAINRTILQHAMSRVAQGLRNPACWILDGDTRLFALKAKDGKATKFCPDYVGEFIRLRAVGCEIAISGVCGAPPLPRALALRGQLVDLLHFMGRLFSSGGGQNAPSLTVAANPSAVAANFYHDCLPHPHLEQPAGMPAALPRRRAAFARALPRVLRRLLAGDAITRPLLAPAVAAPAQRGGNTVVFNPEALCQFPNGFCRGVLRNWRREDEIWRMFSELAFHYKTAAGNFPVTQTRVEDPPQAPDVGRLAADIAGHALLGAFKQAVGAAARPNPRELVRFALRDGDAFCANAAAFAERRLLVLFASFMRVAGAAASMRALLARAYEGDGKEEAIRFLARFERRFSPAAFAKVEQQTRAMIAAADLQKELARFPDDCREFSALRDVWMAWLRGERRKNAAALLAQRGLMERPRFLGSGNEGSVFAAGSLVCKVLHRWRARNNVFDDKFLPSLAGKWRDGDGASHIIDAAGDGGDLILTMPRKASVYYSGGLGAGMTAMLADCRRAGVAYWNIKNKNLRRHGDSAQLIDYGSDVRPFTARDFDLSVRKAWLCWRWGWRKDISALLKASLKSSALPELSGYEAMREAAMQYAIASRPPDRAAQEAAKCAPARVFDCGCGKGKDAIAFAARGAEVFAYDPNMTAKTARRLRAAGVCVVDSPNKAKGEFNVVLLRHVLCEIFSDAQLRRCLAAARRLLAPNGKLVATACALAELAKDTPLARNEFPPGANIEEKFFYRKFVRSVGGFRRHVHRPERLLLREFARAGFYLASRKTFFDINIDRFEKFGAAAQWVLRPLPPAPPVALVVRACAMDASDAEWQVRHLAERLGAPRGFAEVVLAADANEKTFLRRHNSGNLPKMLAVARRLQRRGWVDRVVVPPATAAARRRLNQRWLGVNDDGLLAANGAPLGVSFAAFDACRSRYALHIDIDMFVGRTDEKRDYLGVMLAAMQKRGALAMALNIPATPSAPTSEGAGLPHRVETRAGLVDLKLLKRHLPLPGKTKNGGPAAGWHRAADLLVSQKGLPSLRGGDQRLFVAHPPNVFKGRGDSMDIVANGAMRGATGAQQWRGNDWDGKEEGWLPPPRNEEFVFVVCGRNVSAGKINRCFDSILRQRGGGWGAVVIDDASDAVCLSALRDRAAACGGRVVLFERRRPVGGLANLAFAVRRLCGNPNSAIVTLDLDDALIGDGVLLRLRQEYARGADVTVGSMLRTDKWAEYPVCFADPRRSRGGNVWQHLRSFKKSLFDSVPDSALRDARGNYWELAQDWAYMLPIVETARRPVWIGEPLYLYEPDVARKRAQRAKNERAVARIVALPSFKKGGKAE